MLLERIIGVFARCVSVLCAASALALGAAQSVQAQDLPIPYTFDFNAQPCVEEPCFNPTFTIVQIEPFEELFRVEHTNMVLMSTQWQESDGQGWVETTLPDGTGTGQINFVGPPVTSFSICFAYTPDADAPVNEQASATPIGSDTGVSIPSDGDPNTDDECLSPYTRFVFGDEDGPYTGLDLSVPLNGELQWDNLVVTVADEQAYDPDSTGARNVPVSIEENSTVIQLDAFLMVASNVIAPIGGGDPVLDFDFCVGRDLREAHVPNGPSVYTRRALPVSQVAGTGSCTGDLPGGSTDLPNSAGTASTWEELLAHIDLVIPPWNRTFRGDFEGVDGFWFVIASVRTNVEFDGPILVKEIPEIFPGLAYYDVVPDTEGDGNDFDELACNATLNKRPSGLAGLVTAFGEWPNVERNLMIKSTFRCNRPETMTRRTHHVYPVRHDGVFVDQKAGLVLQLAGIGATIQEAMSCAAAGPSGVGSLQSMRVDLLAATAAALLHQWNKALMRLESIATKANMTTFSTSDGCVRRNYKGNLVGRGLTGAFTVWDSFLHPTVPGWEIYNPPSGLVPPDPTLP